MKRIIQLLCFSLILLMTNCQVEENIAPPKQNSNREELFFKDMPNNKLTSKEGSLIETFLENENKETQFLQKISDQKGIPIWENLKIFKNKSLTNKNSESSVTIIPLTDNDKNLSSLLFVDSKTNGKATIYTITNDELFKIVSNPEIPKETRETILMQFLYFDYLSFGRRLYTNIPVDLFSNIKIKKNKEFKEFKISVSNKSTSSTSRQVSDVCISFNACDGRCQGACDECSSCQSTRCYGFGGSTAPDNFGSSEGGSGDSGSTGGGGSGGGGTSSSPWYLMNPDVDIYKYPSNIRSIFKRLTDYDVILQKEQLDYLKIDTPLLQKLNAFLTNNNLEKSVFANITIDVFMNNGDKVFFNWAIDYLTQNPNVTISQFQNWFMGTSEGQDGDYDAEFWENPNLTFQKQNLPTYNNYLNGMPRFADGSFMIGADNVYALVGGAVQQARIDNPIRTANTCALKVSIALNRAGVIIPHLSGKTLEGSGEFAGKYFFLNAKSLNSWMRETFGTGSENANHFSYTSSDGGINGENFPEKLKDKNGIYSMITTENYSTQNGISGHADLIFNGNAGKGTCIFGCSFNLPIERIDIWILN